MDLLLALRAMGHPTRYKMLDMLMEGVQCNCELAQRLDLALNLVSYHMRALQQAGLVESERDQDDARWIYYMVRTAALDELRRGLDALLDSQRIQPRTPQCGPRKSCGC